MLKGIPSILTPDLLKIIMEMGHGDELLIADGNYPKFGQPDLVIHMEFLSAFGSLISFIL